MIKANKVINLDEEFPHLNRAPIVEAVIDIRGVFKKKWNEGEIRDYLKEKLPSYSKSEVLKEQKIHFSSDKLSEAKVEDLGSAGLKFHSDDKLHIAQFNKSQFVFSRLTPYEDWSQFSNEAIKIMLLYSELLEPEECRRIGLRFINRIEILDDRVELSDYFKSAPQSLREDLDWPFSGFLHRDVIQVPTTPYVFNLMKTIQPSQNPTNQSAGLILDIDVFFGSHFPWGEGEIKEHLENMHWVKNKAFFSSITDKVIDELKD